MMKSIRISIYLFVIILCYLFLHYKSLSNLFSSKMENKEETKIVNDITNINETIKPQIIEQITPIQPTTTINFNDYIL